MLRGDKNTDIQLLILGRTRYTWNQREFETECWTDQRYTASPSLCLQRKFLSHGVCIYDLYPMEQGALLLQTSLLNGL